MLTQPNGLLMKFRVYFGSADKVAGGLGHVEMVIKYQLDVGHAIYMDNYYSGVGQTAYCLDQWWLTSCGLRARLLKKI